MPIGNAPALVESWPTPPAPRFGLLSVAQVPDLTGVPWMDGITYPAPTSLEDVSVDAVACDAMPDMAVTDGLPWLTADPLRVSGGVACKRPGLLEGEAETAARAKLAASEGPALEAALWPMFLDGADLPAGDAAGSPLAGIGVLEGWLWETYSSTGVLHVARNLVPYLVRAKQVREVNGVLQTPLGTPVSAGAYPSTVGPEGSAPTGVGAGWIAATGAVRLLRTPITVVESFNHRTNVVKAFAQRLYVPAWDDVAAAVNIQFETL